MSLDHHGADSIGLLLGNLQLARSSLLAARSDRGYRPRSSMPDATIIGRRRK